MISVCIATYNGEKYILEQLRSILPQLSESDEIVVSDDNSTDETISIIKSINDKRIRIFKHTKQKSKFHIDNVTHNFENALLRARGDIIMLADQDDVWREDKVRMMTEALKDCDLVMSNCYVTDGKLNIISNSYQAERPFKFSILANFIKSSFLGSCMAFKNRVLKSSLPFPQYGVAHDLWIGIVALHKYKVKNIDTPLIYYRRHDNTMTLSGMKNTNSIWFKISYRFYVLCAILRLRTINETKI